ncbi:MAG: FmdB family zinc ribbon protein [Bryobacteraceae bacterium]
MPLYEYKCSRCGKAVEVLQRFSDAQLQVHAGCGGALERVISPSAFNFKGTGWYVTDYGRGGKKNGRDAKKGVPSKSDAGSPTSKPAESKSSSEPAAKS